MFALVHLLLFFFLHVSWFKTTLKSLQIYYTKRNHASIVIQSYTRRFLAQVLRDFLYKEKKSIMIQCCYRQYLSRKTVLQLKKERLAEMIYKVWRIFLLHYHRYRLYRQKKAFRIQRFYYYHRRRYYMKKYYQVMMPIHQLHQRQVRGWRTTILRCFRLVYLKKKHAKSRVMR